MLMSLSAAAPPQTDDFRHGLSHWRVEAEAPARVTVESGVLDIDTPEGLSVWWGEELSGPVAIEYEVMAVSAGGPNDAVSDVNAFWMATDSAAPGGSPLARPRSGAFAAYDALKTYYVGIGGNRNTTTRMRRYLGEPGNRPLLPEHDRTDPAALLVANRWVPMRLAADGATVTVDFGGKRLFTMTDAAPYRRGWFALRTTKSHLRIRNFRIVPLGTGH
ncbi:MAG: Tat pathway signal sequence domain protein [Novosphingobium sp.]|nr:Tat pathway signal sequence domain protein [Novosphingobium sp.]